MRPESPGAPAALSEALRGAGMGELADVLPAQFARCCAAMQHGDLPRWQSALSGLPDLRPSLVRLDTPDVQIGRRQDGGDPQTRQALRRQLQGLMPWRKGPFNFFGVRIDSEWRSDLKWSRIAAGLADLRGRRVLDVGCGNGYFAWRMLGAGARAVLGVEPNPLFVAQCQAARRYLPHHPLLVLPMRLHDFAAMGLGGRFDSVFSMGVLYHQRDPVQHLRELLACLRAGGELVVETLVVTERREPLYPGRYPGGRYAGMHNVHCIPSRSWMLSRLAALGLGAVRMLAPLRSTTEEQRSTEWMRFHSLRQALHPQHQDRTIEGHPAPVRAFFLAVKP